MRESWAEWAGGLEGQSAGLESELPCGLGQVTISGGGAIRSSVCTEVSWSETWRVGHSDLALQCPASHSVTLLFCRCLCEQPGMDVESICPRAQSGECFPGLGSYLCSPAGGGSVAGGDLITPRPAYLGPACPWGPEGELASGCVPRGARCSCWFGALSACEAEMDSQPEQPMCRVPLSSALVCVFMCVCVSLSLAHTQTHSFIYPLLDVMENF